MQDREEQGAIRLCAKRMCILSENETLDRISWLPEHIIHEILDNLSSKDAARTSILSKTWKSFTNSYSILHLDHNLFGLKCLVAAGNSRNEPNIREIREEFMSFVKYHLSKVIHQKLALRRLTLNVAIEDSKSFSRVDQLMDLVCKLSKVEELCIFVQTNEYRGTNVTVKYDIRDIVISIGKDGYGKNVVRYNIPSSVLALNGLRYLYVHGCKFGSLVGNHFRSNICSLQRLSLLQASLDEGVLINLARYCPGIEILEFDRCTFWDYSLELSVFPRLKKVSIHKCNGNLNFIYIDKDGLESFKCNLIAHCQFISTACRSIRELIVSYCMIGPPNLFVELTTTFPLIEDMEISSCCGFSFTERFKAVSRHLRKLSIPFPKQDQVNHMSIDCPNLEFLKLEGNGLKEVYLNCPNLRQLLYTGNAIPAFPLFNTSAALKVIHYQVNVNTTYFNSLWFMHFRGLIKQMALVGRTIHLNLGFSPKMVEFIPLEYGAFLASMQSDVHLTIRISLVTKFISNNLAGFVDGLIWSTCPTTLTFTCLCDGFLEDFCEKLAKKPRNESCREFCNKCWWHYIVDFEVESFPAINPPIKYIKENLPTFVKMYQKYRTRQTCTFKLYWRRNEGRQNCVEDVQQIRVAQLTP